MIDQQFFSSALSLSVNEALVLLLCFGVVACGNETESGYQTQGNTAVADIDPEAIDTTSSSPEDTASGESSRQVPEDTASGEDTSSGESSGQVPVDISDDGGFEEVETEGKSSQDKSSENDGSDQGTPADSVDSDPPEPEPERSILEFDTDPGAAAVTIENQETGSRTTKETPATFEVTPGLYSWSVEKEGYTTKDSRQAIDLTTQTEEEIEVGLSPVAGEGAYLDRGRSAHQQGNYQRAVDLYSEVPEPSAEEDPSDYFRAQARSGQIYWRQLENYEAAIQSYQNILEYDDTRYEPFLNLARIHYETENYEKALEHLNSVSDLEYQIPSQNQERLKVTLRARHLRGLSLFEQAKEEGTRNRRAKALKANQAFQGFLSAVPSDLESTFSQLIEEANQKKEKVRTLLREEIR